MSDPRIDENGLPLHVPGDYDYVRAVRRDTGASVNVLAPEVTAAARELAGALDQVVADAEEDIAPVIAGLGYLPPVPFASGLNVDSSRFTVTHDGQVYAPVSWPFTTTSTFNPAQWRLVQGVVGVDLAGPAGAGMVGMPGGLSLASVLSVRPANEDPSNLGVVLGDTTAQAAVIGKGSLLIGAYADHQKHRLPGTRQLRGIVGGYDCEITPGTAGDTGGLACFIVGSHHSEVQGKTTHAFIGGGSYHKILGGDYGNILGGTLNEIRAFKRNGTTPSVPNTSTVCGGYGNIIFEANTVIVGGRANSADGVYAFIGGGNQNIADGNFNVVVGGGQNEARAGGNGVSQKNTIGGGRYNIIDSGTSGNSNTIAGGESNTLHGHYSVIGGGRSNAVSSTAGNADHATIAGGYANIIGAVNGATIGGGRENSVSAGVYGTVTGGRANVASADYARAGGHQAVARHVYGDTLGAGAFAAAGDAQTSALSRKVLSSNAAWTPFTTIALADDSTVAFDVLIVARCPATSESAAYKISGCVDRGAGAATTALVGVPVKSELGGDAAAWDVRAIANTSSGGLQVQVMGEAGKSIRWVARMALAEVSA